MRAVILATPDSMSRWRRRRSDFISAAPYIKGGCGGVLDRGCAGELLLVRFCGAGQITGLFGFGGRRFKSSLRLRELKNVFGCLDLREEALIARLLQGDAGMSRISAAQFARER